MNTPVSCFLAIITVAAAGQAWAADVGRVLLAAGDTVAVRDMQVVKLAFGSAVQDKDLLRTGPASNLHVRFTDESLIAIRENSEIRIDEFRFTGKEDGTERAIFSLLKGGLRKITGIIGRTNNKNYEMNSAVATIGIRGTHYLAALCQKDCRNPDGTPAKDGLYGLPIAASSTSRNSVTNQTGEHIFGIGQPYYVQDFKTAPQMLLEPPGLLAVAVKGRTAKPPAGTGTEQADAGGAGQDARGTTPLPPSVVLPRLLAGSSSTTDSFLDPVSAATTGASPETAVVAGSIPDMGNGGIAYFGGVQSPTTSSGQAMVSASLSADAQGQQLTAFSDGSITGLSGSASTMDVGSNAAAGNLHWGVWSSGTVNGSSVAFLHYIVGDVPSLPGTGRFTYSPVGGTRPTNNLGMTGSFLGGNVTVDFLARQLSVNNLQIGFNSATYTMNSSMQAFQANGLFGGGLSATCTGNTCGTSTPVSGNYAGSFVGANAPGMAMVYRALDPGGNGDIIGAQGFKR